MAAVRQDEEGHRRFEGVLLDLWGTLLPYAEESARRENLAEMARILEVDPTKFTNHWISTIGERCLGRLGSLEATIELLATRLGGHPSSETVDRALELRMEFSRVTLDRGEPLLPALDALRSGGFRLAIVSDSTEETVRLWPETRLSSRFETAVFSFVEGACKPDPRMYSRALERLGLSPADCLYVGDGGSRELTGAEAVGLTARKYRYPDEHRDAPRFDEDSHWRGPSLTDLRDLLALGPGRAQRLESVGSLGGLDS